MNKVKNKILICIMIIIMVLTLKETSSYGMLDGYVGLCENHVQGSNGESIVLSPDDIHQKLIEYYDYKIPEGINYLPKNLKLDTFFTFKN